MRACAGALVAGVGAFHEGSEVLLAGELVFQDHLVPVGSVCAIAPGKARIPVRVKRLFIALGLLLVLALACIVAGGAVLLVAGGVSAKAEPTRLEAAIARRLLRMGIPGEYKQLRNPVAPQPSAAGRAHFADHCAVCHATDGSGQTEMGRNLYPRSPDLRRAETQELSDGELFYIIENGVRLTGMPGWGDGSEHSKHETWQVVAFIRHLPRLTREEKLEMERMNPKSMAEWREMQEDEEFLQGRDQPARTK